MTNSNPGGVGGRKKKIQTNIPQGQTGHQKPKKEGFIARLLKPKKGK